MESKAFMSIGCLHEAHTLPPTLTAASASSCWWPRSPRRIFWLPNSTHWLCAHPGSLLFIVGIVPMMLSCSVNSLSRLLACTYARRQGGCLGAPAAAVPQIRFRPVVHCHNGGWYCINDICWCPRLLQAPATLCVGHGGYTSCHAITVMIARIQL
jgi:hypothetical protein